MEKVIIVVVETDRKAFQYRSRQFSRGAAPLFLCVAFEERLIKIRTDKTQRLFLKRFWICDGQVCLRLNKSTGLVRSHGLEKKLVYCVQVDRQGKDLPQAGRFYPVLIWQERPEAVHIGPNFFVIGMKNMGAVDVHHDACVRIAFGMAVAANMSSRINDCYVMTRFCQSATDHRARQSSAYHQ